MNKTVLYKEISGYKIITGFSELSIDPVATKIIVDKKLKQTKIGKRIILLIKKIEDLDKLIVGIHPGLPHCQNEEAIRKLLTKNKVQQAINHIKERIGIVEELANLNEEIVKERVRLKLKHAVYFEPTAYEIVKPDEEIQKLKDKFKQLNKNQLLDVHGNIVRNYTGINFWIKRDKWECVNFGLGENKDPAAKIPHDLTDKDRKEISEQLEYERIEKLNPREKEIEKQKAIETLTIASVSKKAGLEIAGETSEKALKKSRAWYKKEFKKIEKKYG